MFSDSAITFQCAKPPFPGRPSSQCPRHEGAGPPLLRGEGLVYRTIRLLKGDDRALPGLWG